MPRPQKPWYRKQTGWWMVEFDGHQEKLVQGPKDEEHRILAEEKFVELRKLRRVSPEAVASRTADVIEAFLVHSRLNHAPDTHRGHKYYCQLFAEYCGQVLARELKPHHITAWVTAMQSEDRVAASLKEKDRLRRELPAGEGGKAGGNPRRWGPTSVYNARKTAFTVFSWAAKEKFIPDNPLAGMPRPKPKPRQRAITDDEFQKLHDNAGGPLQDVLTALYHTGARPKEVRDLVWVHVREDRWVLPEHKTGKKTGKPRVIFLNEQMRVMMKRLQGNGHTHVFLNTEGEPWTTSALRQQVWRIKKKLKLADDLCAYQKLLKIEVQHEMGPAANYWRLEGGYSSSATLTSCLRRLCSCPLLPEPGPRADGSQHHSSPVPHLQAEQEPLPHLECRDLEGAGRCELRRFPVLLPPACRNPPR